MPSCLMLVNVSQQNPKDEAGFGTPRSIREKAA
jgi:hypothetical protein